MPKRERQVFPQVPVRLPDGQWRVWYIGRPVVPIINREGLSIEIRPLDNRRCIQGTGERKEWLLLHIALTLAIEQRPGKYLTERAYRETRKRLDHLVGYSPVLGDRPTVTEKGASLSVAARLKGA